MARYETKLVSGKKHTFYDRESLLEYLKNFDEVDVKVRVIE